jgi:tRNA uridine 5-carboxymethylaminomethyl modification enzyme
MFTSRVEYRLVVREDNADQRMAGYALEFGLISGDQYDKVLKKYQRVSEEIQLLRETRIYPGSAEGHVMSDLLEKKGTSRMSQPMSLAEILKRPQACYDDLRFAGASLPEDQHLIIDQVSYEIKYQGFIERQLKDIDRLKHIENIKLPMDINFSQIPGLSIEVQQKLTRFSPQTLGQAHRISGITPAAISILMIYLKKLSFERRADKK